ncbi:ABC transporter permease subunit [Bacillus sp. BP-3]|uniref:ABC transporter permease subunit n=1 Tax=Bacillus sp. BP-3 TaxID=3022773 RepID=UPI00232F75AD|nr:ABC transporter permease subunit [Bacillus sp. BP-3]MDC2865002.1 ABC transporter permease subunit [Bacillus sp. BP-3]
MKGFFIEKCIEFCICIVVIMVISYVPFVFLGNNPLSFTTFLQQIFTHGDAGNPMAMRQVAFWDIIWEPYMYSGIILLASTCLTVLIATCLSFGYVLSSLKVKKAIERCLVLIESIPDLLLIFMLQIFFVWVYKQTGINFVNIYAFGSKQAYFLPIVTMSLVPALHFFRIMVLFLLDEQNKPYVEFARAKGLSRKYIVFVHLFRNVIYHLFNHLQSTFLVMISSLLLVEAAFNINGYMSFILKPFVLNPVTIAQWILLLFIPFYIVFTIAHFQVKRTTGGLANEK